jgi:hypothetical protein
MPIKHGTIFCINHPDAPMVRNSGFNAITSFDQTPVGYTFNPTSGIPVVAFFCSECGYIETYVAQKTPYWGERKLPQDQIISSSARTFETSVLEALSAPDSPFAAGTAMEHVRFTVGSHSTEADAIIQTPDAIYVFEIKQTASPKTLGLAAAQARHSAQLFKESAKKRGEKTPVFPIVAVPSGTTPVLAMLGVPILKFDTNARRFENSEAVLEYLRKEASPA